MCGEKSKVDDRQPGGQGSPPHVRGKAVLHVGDLGYCGITPAYAGKRHEENDLPRPDQDHPRICGEKSPIISISPGERGSPPHMRGKAEFANAGYAVMGITPAYAGKRSPRRRTNSFSRDHPRICGEKLYFFSKLETMRGSPPHMRGKGDVAHMTMKEIGITPAYAGKRCTRCAASG